MEVMEFPEIIDKLIKLNRRMAILNKKDEERKKKKDEERKKKILPFNSIKRNIK